MQLLVSGWSWNLVLIGFTFFEILRFLYFGVLAWNCIIGYLREGGLGSIFPQNDVTHHPNPKKHFFTRKHVVWVIKREIGSAVWPGRVPKKNRQERTGRDSQIRSSATAKSTLRPSCLVGVLYDISREKICWWLINHFYVISHKSYRIRRNDAK